MPVMNKNMNAISAENTPNHLRTPKGNSRNNNHVSVQNTTADSSRRSRLMTPPVEMSGLSRKIKTNTHRTN